MKVVISGGIRTENIVNGINKRFNSGGIDFIVVPFIEDIEDIYQRGEYFDKAIIIEQCWNHDFEDDDEVIIRNRINRFASESQSRGMSNVSYVFLTQDSDIAAKVYEEILPIQHSSVVIVKAPRYSVSFFNTLVTTEIDKFSEELIYVPDIAAEVKMDDTFDSSTDNKKPDIDYDVNYEDEDISKALFGDEDEEYNANGLDKPDGIDFDFSKQDEIDDIPSNWPDDTDTDVEIEEIEDRTGLEMDQGFEDDRTFKIGDLPNLDFDNGFEDLGTETDNIQSIDNDENVDVSIFDDTIFDIETADKFQKSGDIPDYSAPETTFQQEMYTDELYNTTENNISDYNPDLDNFNGNQQSTEQFNDEDYDGEPTVVAPNQRQYQRMDMSNDQIKATLDAFANRGNSIVVTGCGGCGTSTIALNIANIVNNLGYTVLLVDLDTEHKAQSYMSRENYECVEPDSAGLMAAINSTSGINAHVSIVRQGFHLLTMGMASDSVQIEKVIQKEKISRFINLAKTSHNFVIYDVPFKTAIGFGKDFTYMADNIVMTVDCSNWGISKTMLNMCNIEDDDMQETIFNRGQLLFNRYRVLNKVMGRKVKTAIDITKVMDFKVRELLGEDPGFYFQSMHICGLINEDYNFESGWFDSTQYSDTDMGSKMFLELVKNIVLKR